jgi:hypothetical protein
MKTKFKTWDTSKSSNAAAKKMERLTLQYPDTVFHIKTKSWPHKDKKAYAVRSVARKGHKR